MYRLKNILILTAVAGVLGVVGTIASSRKAVAQSGTPVSIVSPVPLPVRDVRTEVRTPFQTTGYGPGSFNVEPNQRLTIELVSTACALAKSSPGSTFWLTQ